MSKHNGTLSLERLQEILHYDPETGIFRWKVSRGKGKAGAVAGNISGHGYVRIRIKNILHFAHRLAWFYITGVWPKNLIDHRNGDKSDNRFSNLRQATYSQNAQNSLSSRGRSRHRGVLWNVPQKKWYAQIAINKKNHYLGLFDTEEDAAEAYKLARQRFHPFAPVNQTASDTISGNLKCEPDD